LPPAVAIPACLDGHFGEAGTVRAVPIVGTSTRRLIMKFASLFSSIALLLLPACGARIANGTRNAEGPEIAIQRGGAWSTLTVAPPRIVGPSVELQLKQGVLRGFAGGGAMDVQIGRNEASGYGPSGPVQLEVESRDGQLVVGGMWNGGPVHFTLSDGVVKGSIVRRSSRTIAGEQSCGYELGRTGTSGPFVGRSSCGGMPQETRLEIDPRVPKLLTPTEMTVVLVAALATPPMTREWN
jgi:hypothetical protein